jgi:hypothetical protein
VADKAKTIAVPKHPAGKKTLKGSKKLGDTKLMFFIKQG